MSEMNANRSGIRCVNTPNCWEIRGKFFIEFKPEADLFCFGADPGVVINGTVVTLESARIKQSDQQDHLKVYVGGNVIPYAFSSDLIVGIYDESENRVWD